MRRLHVYSGLAAVALVLSGCAGFGVDRARKTEATGGEFERALYAGYLSLAQSEFDEGDYADSDRFAMRAIHAAEGKAPAPEKIADRKLPAESLGALAEAHRRLVAALDAGARESQPVEAARAQTSFDCWMQEQEENFQPDDIAACRESFGVQIARLEEAMKPAPVAAVAPTPEPAPMPAPEPAPGFLVYFDFDSAKIGQSAEAMIDRVAAAASKHAAKRIVVKAHADTAGDEGYNQRLSEMRAEAIAEALAQRGLTATVDKRAVGEKQPLVPTGDGVAEPGNRVVLITFGQ